MKSMLTIAFISLLTITSDISMLGVKIGDSQQSLEKIKLQVVAQEDDMIKFRTSNGNDFSVTSENGRIVYMENDWLQDSDNRQSIVSNFQFGITSLKDIRRTFKNNGFVYVNRGGLTTDTDLIQFNCFEFDSTNNEVLILITKVSLKTDVTEANIAESLKLDAVIIADKNYLDNAWGNEKKFDPNYKKIKF